MTHKIFVTDLLEIRKIKVSCRKCGFAVSLPLGDKYGSLNACASCQRTFPASYVDDLIREIKNLRTALTKDSNYFVFVEFETAEATGSVTP